MRIPDFTAFLPLNQVGIMVKIFILWAFSPLCQLKKFIYRASSKCNFSCTGSALLKQANNVAFISSVSREMKTIKETFIFSLKDFI